MSEDVFGRLKDLSDEVRARIEASADWKTLTAVERAMAEVKALLPEVAVAAPASAAVEVSAEPEPVEEVAAPIEAMAAADVEVEADDAGDAAAMMAEIDTETEEPETTPAEVQADAEPEATAAEAPETMPVADIPAEDQALVAELVTAESATATPSEVTTH
ncbi:MAG: hypothetical protein K2X41_10985 [Hyphomicrobium sp.]|nr:hypothetical protein [Hyphomicrobium sp.]